MIRALKGLDFLIFVTASMFFLESAKASPRTVKTNHTDVNLWSTAGREDGKKIEKIRKFEEIQVLGEKTLENGQTWYRVQLRRYPDDRLVETVGWVDAKYFTELDVPTDADQPPESIEATDKSKDCADCNAGKDAPYQAPSPVKEISTVKKAIVKSNGFIWPVPGHLRSGFGYRKHPIKGVVKLHRGMDISGNNGANVRAAKGGIVEVSAGGCRTGKKKKWKNCNGGAGNMVTIKHDDGTKTRYFHLNESSRLPKKGTRIAQGTLLGVVGATGAVTGPHLHFELIKNGKWVNPLNSLPKRT